MTNLNFSFFSEICKRTIFSKNSVDSLPMTRNSKLIGKHIRGGTKNKTSRDNGHQVHKELFKNEILYKKIP